MDNPPCKIIDVNGRVVDIIKSNSISDKIDLSFLYRGTYFLMIDFPEKRVVLKFIKE